MIDFVLSRINERRPDAEKLYVERIDVHIPPDVEILKTRGRRCLLV